MIRNEDKFTWEEINLALLRHGLSAKNIGNIMSELNKIKNSRIYKGGGIKIFPLDIFKNDDNIKIF